MKAKPPTASKKAQATNASISTSSPSLNASKTKRTIEQPKK